MKYYPFIGLEVHIQTKTKSKMFCSCPTDYFGQEPNTRTCPTCLGLPGALPTINKSAINCCIKLALALHCNINRFTKFDRKNYFYPDLPKGYQISQYDLPIGYNGYLDIETNREKQKIKIIRVHQEEDTGKSIHENDKTLLDFNKSGIPLVEIVTAPDFHDIPTVIEFAKEVKRIVRYLDVSDANMERGQMRFELNLSMQKLNIKKLPDYKVEVKNIGSISVLEKVINFEIKRQIELLEKGKKVIQETRGLKGMTGETVSQRFKEGNADYRYFPEPDLPPIKIDDTWIEGISEEIPELPYEKRARFEKSYNIPRDAVKIITEDVKRSAWFEEAIRNIPKESVKDAAKWFVGDFMNLKKKSKLKFSELKFKPVYIGEIILLIKEGSISGGTAKQVLAESFETGKSPKEIVRGKNLKQVNNAGELQEIVERIIKNNPKPVDDYKKGKVNALQFLLGQVMRETKGRANPKIVLALLKNMLN